MAEFTPNQKKENVYLGSQTQSLKQDKPKENYTRHIIIKISKNKIDNFKDRYMAEQIQHCKVFKKIKTAREK